MSGADATVHPLMSISEQIPYLPMSHVTDFLLIPKEAQVVKETPAGPALVSELNPRYRVSDYAIERSRRIWAEKDAAMRVARNLEITMP